MESIKGLVQQMQNLSNCSPQSTELSIERGEISLYDDALAGPKDIVDASVKIKKSFPLLPMGFYDMFDIRIRETGFTAQRLIDAVNFVIDNCIYSQPTIANFISYDRTVKFKTHEQMCKEDLWSSHVAVKFPDMPKVVWVFANDIEKYKLNKYLVR